MGTGRRFVAPQVKSWPGVASLDTTHRALCEGLTFVRIGHEKTRKYGYISVSHASAPTLCRLFTDPDCGSNRRRRMPDANKFFSSVLLNEVVARAMPEERDALTAILHDGIKVGTTADDLQAQICAYAGNAVGNFLRGGDGVSYAELLFDAAEHLKVEHLTSRYLPFNGELSLAQLDRLSSEKAKTINTDHRWEVVDGYVDDLERKILAKLMVVAYEKAAPAQRAAIDAKLAEVAKTPEGKSLSGLSASAAFLVIGNLGGFATYTLMSTVLSAVSLGTLGFGAYTLASSMLSVVLGPAGWLSLAVYGVFKWGSADAGRVVRLAATCAMTSQRLREKLR
jgi:uncharacterized protein YaaW (UPF0174 family)